MSGTPNSAIDTEELPPKELKNKQIRRQIAHSIIGATEKR
jgi:hypothetical protein